MIACLEVADLLVPHQLTVYLELQSCYVEKDVLEWLQKGNVYSIWLLGNPWAQHIKQASKHVNREGESQNAKASIRNSSLGKLVHAASFNDEAGGCRHDAVTQDRRSHRLICSEGHLHPQHDQLTCTEICAMPCAFFLRNETTTLSVTHPL